MTTLSRAQHPAGAFSMPSSSHYRVPATNGHTGVFTSPTESEFGDNGSMRDSPVDWDEARVGDWLRSINCAQYVELFRSHNINGENLLELDKRVLQEIGVKKMGDRVRIERQARGMRSNVYKRSSKRAVNRHSLAALDGNATLTPPSSGSPRPLHSARLAGTSRAEKRMSRQLGAADLGYAPAVKIASRPGSPMIDQENRAVRMPRASPMESVRKEASGSYFGQPSTARYVSSTRATASETPQTARFASHIKSSPSIDNLNTSIVGALPSDKPLIRVIYENGRSSVVNIDGFRTAEDIIRTTLRKAPANENHFRSYCFYVLDGTDPNPTFCRKLGEAELVRLCNDGVRSERGRLILRKIHTGEPEGEQLRTAARIAEQQQPEPPAIEVQPTAKSRSQLKIEKLTGEPLAAVSYPMSPASQAARREYFDTAATSSVSRSISQASTASARARKLKDFYGARPPTELITQDLQSYFPEVAKEEMDRTVRMSIRRSQRLSRAVSRLSTVSNFSVASSLRDAPPIPSIAEHWAKEAGAQRQPGLRPLSIMRLGRPESYRESVVGSMLEPLDEESPLEPNRRSYVSFGGESGSDQERNNLSITDPEGNTIMQSYFDDTQSSPGNTVGVSDAGSGSLNSRLSQFIAEDGEEEDEELMEHLEKDSWDDLKYMKGAMIGQGSFGTVFLALHAVTAELMAVKQVELPSSTDGSTQESNKKKMIEALKNEMDLLRRLTHPNIVQYLGSNADSSHLNIFLEYVAGGSVATMLVNYGSLPELLISSFVRQILSGLKFMHSKDIIHRDIKGANILVDNKGTVKISDFGISKVVEHANRLGIQTNSAHGGMAGRGLKQRVSLQGSVFWMAPEVVRQTVHTQKSDIWSLGCLVVEMFTGSHPHPNCTQLQALFKIGHTGNSADSARPDIPETASDAMKAFLGKTFEIEHERRPTAEELEETDFVKGAQKD